MDDSKRIQKIGLFSLISIIVGSMIGAGAFSLPTDIARKANITAIIIGWVITGLGMICLALVFQNLSNRKPELKGGIYTYAKAGFGKFVGFNSAWGYWLSAIMGNVAYILLFFDSLSFFFPVFSNAQGMSVLVGAAILLWVIHMIALKGIRDATFINIITTVARLIPIFALIVIMLLVFNIHNLTFSMDNFSQTGGLFSQVKNTMVVTVWVFIGIEGAVVLSDKAKKTSDVGKSTIYGLLITLAIYVLLSIAVLGGVPRDVLMGYENPTIAYALEYVVGSWGAWFINVGLCIALFGSTLGWMLLAAETPYIASKDGVMPKFFSIQNKNRASSVSLWITNAIVQAFLLISHFSNSTYQLLYALATVTILPPYLLSALYGLRIAIKKESYKSSKYPIKDIILASIASIYGVWLIYASGLNLLLSCFILYMLGMVVFIYTKIKNKEKIFNGYEWVIASAIIVIAIIGITAISKGMVSI